MAYIYTVHSEENTCYIWSQFCMYAEYTLIAQKHCHSNEDTFPHLVKLCIYNQCEFEKIQERGRNLLWVSIN